MLFQGKTNGLNQYFSWENGYDGPAQHWGTTTNYDDDVGGEWGAPGAANGVLMQDGYITAGYNALNQPIKMWGKSYFSADWMWFGYDPLGRLVKRWKSSSGDPNTTSATFFYYDGSSLVQEGPAAAFVDRVYVHGGRIDEIVASQVSGVWYNHHYDAQGSCILLSNDSGGIEQQYDYDAFGFPYFYTGSGGKAGSPKTRFLFTGREWIVDMRIYDFRARMYQPELGRFLQPDPVEFAASDYNLYRYCHNDPVNSSDPMGLREQLAGEIMRDSMWDFACRMDSGDSFQGEYSAFPNGHDHTAMGNGDGGSGGGGDGGRRYSFAQVSQSNGADEATIQKSRRILAQQTKEGEDSTGAIVDGKPVPGDTIRGKQVPYRFGKPVYAASGNSVLVLRKVDHYEEPPVPSRPDALSHYHSRTGFNSHGVSVAEPTPLDMRALTKTGFMLFSNPNLKAQGAYRIYRDGVPGYVTRHDLYDP